jgi:UDP-2,3-diacylglucosamine hydrolase
VTPLPGAGVAGAAPALFELNAPATWQVVDFISDLHLGTALPRTVAALHGHLAHTDADAVFILGDLFELWVGDDARERAFERHCVDMLAEAASRIQLFFMQGNRDFLVGSAMLRACGMTGLPDPTVFSAWGQRLVLSHGDALCLADERYQEFRRMVRDADWQAVFLARPLDERLQVAAEVRQASHSNQLQRQFDGDMSVDVDTALAVQWLHTLGARELVHGHTHRPGSNALAPGYKRHVLSDWDLDQGHRAEVLRLTRAGFERRPPDHG